MSMDLEILCISCFVNVPQVVVLSISNGITGCGCPISRRQTRSGVSILALTKAPAIYDSEVANIARCNMLSSA